MNTHERKEILDIVRKHRDGQTIAIIYPTKEDRDELEKLELPRGRVFLKGVKGGGTGGAYDHLIFFRYDRMDKLAQDLLLLWLTRMRAGATASFIPDPVEVPAPFQQLR